MKPVYRFITSRTDELSKLNEDIKTSVDECLKIVNHPESKRFFDQLMTGLEVSNIVRIVPEPAGNKRESSYGPFREIYREEVRRFFFDPECGNIYAKFDENSWLQIPFHKIV